MKRSDSTSGYTAKDDKTDWARIDAATEEELEATIASDADEAGIVWNNEWAAEVPQPPKQAVSIRLDPDVLGFFRESGKGYQTRINAVLRSYMDQVRKRAS